VAFVFHGNYWVRFHISVSYGPDGLNRLGEDLKRVSCVSLMSPPVHTIPSGKITAVSCPEKFIMVNHIIPICAITAQSSGKRSQKNSVKKSRRKSLNKTQNRHKRTVTKRGRRHPQTIKKASISVGVRRLRKLNFRIRPYRPTVLPLHAHSGLGAQVTDDILTPVQYSRVMDPKLRRSPQTSPLTPSSTRLGR
jgi:hypothetical protein